MINIKEIIITDYTLEPNVGYEGEHRSTNLNIRLTNDLISENIDYYTIEFKPQGQSVIQTEALQQEGGYLTIQLWQQIMVSGILEFQVIAWRLVDGEVSKIGKSPIIKVKVGKSVSGEYEELDDNVSGLIVELQNLIANYPVQMGEFNEGTEWNFELVDGLLNITYVKAKDGEDGNNGLTPEIGENGNWFIGGVDTGILADVTLDELRHSHDNKEAIDQITEQMLSDISDNTSARHEHDNKESVLDELTVDEGVLNWEGLPISGSWASIVDTYGDLADVSGNVAIVLQGRTGYKYLAPTDGNPFLRYTNLYLNPVPIFIESAFDIGATNIDITATDGTNTVNIYSDVVQFGDEEAAVLVVSINGVSYVWSSSTLTFPLFPAPQGWSFREEASTFTKLSQPPTIPTGDYELDITQGEAGWVLNDTPFNAFAEVWFKEEGLWKQSTKRPCIVQDIADLPENFDGESCIVLNGQTYKGNMEVGTYAELFINPIPRTEKTDFLYLKIKDAESDNEYEIIAERNTRAPGGVPAFANATREVQTCSVFGNGIAPVLAYFWASDKFEGTHYALGDLTFPRGWSKAELNGSDITITPISYTELPTISYGIITESFRTTAECLVRDTPYNPSPAIYYRANGTWCCDSYISLDNTKQDKVWIYNNALKTGCVYTHTTVGPIEFILPAQFEMDATRGTTEFSRFYIDLKVTNDAHKVSFNEPVKWVGSFAPTLTEGNWFIEAFFSPVEEIWVLFATSYGSAV